MIYLLLSTHHQTELLTTSALKGTGQRSLERPHMPDLQQFKPLIYQQLKDIRFFNLKVENSANFFLSSILERNHNLK